MTSEIEKSKVFDCSKYYAEVYFRETKRNYPLHDWAVRFVQKTPNGKYLKEKSINHFVYKTYDDAINAASSWIERLKTNITKREEDRKARRLADSDVKASDFYKVGDIVENTWGYEQTNVFFYLVLSVGPKTIKIKEIGQKVVEGSEYSHGMACEVLPDPSFFYERGDEYTLRVKSEGRLSNPKSFYYMHKWDGRAKYKSWYY